MLRYRARGLLCALAACPVALAAKPPTPPAPPVPTAPRVAPLSPEAKVEAVQAEKEALSRRMEICTQLRRVAADTNDAKLEAEALQLEQMAVATCKQRLQKLGVKFDARPATGLLDPIDRVSGSVSTAEPSVSPSAPMSVPATARLNQFREVKP